MIDADRLRSTLNRLKTQLEHASLDAETAARLKEAIKEIESAVASGARPAGDASLTNRLSEAALDFEASHPTLAGTVGSVIDALASMGI